MIPASDLAVELVNWDVTHSFEPRMLPKVDLSKGITPEARTMVVVPVMFSDEATVGALVDKLEIAYLANQDEHFHFALLGDFVDADQEYMPEDRALSRPRITASKNSINATARAHRFVFTFFIGLADGVRRKGNGLVGSESVASCASSIGCFVGKVVTSFIMVTAARICFADSLRHYARRRHSVAARCRASSDWRGDSSAKTRGSTQPTD